MTLHFVAALAWKSVICAGFCLLLLLVLRRRSAAQKSLVALAGVLALILLPASSFLIPSVAISTPQPVADAMSVAAGVFSAPGQVEAPPLMSRGGASADWSSGMIASTTISSDRSKAWRTSSLNQSALPSRTWKVPNI